MKPFRLGLLSVAALLAGTLVALAQGQVTVTAGVNAYQGPGPQYEVIGFIPAYATVVLDRCESNYCNVYFGRRSGWIEQQYIAAPQPPAPPPVPLPQPQPWPQPEQPRPPLPPVYDQAGACFYSERNFGGASFCLDEGDSFSRLRNWDNRIRSVDVFGGAYLDLCTDANFVGSCVTLSRSASRLPAGIDRRVTSVDVY